jgi:ankyrin repeat protein
MDIKHNSNNGGNALLISTEFGHIKIIEYLIDRGIDVNTKNVLRGATPLMLAT